VFFGELDACFENEEAKKVRLLLFLSLSLLSLNFLLQQFVNPPKKKKKKKKKKK
jgi:hypothetical protein